MAAHQPVSHSAPPNSTVPRLPELDGLRGIAILAVMSFHFFFFAVWMGVRFPTDGLQSGMGVLGPLLLSGWVGVDLFFALSGFLITTTLLNAKMRARFFRNFYTRRALRIFPLYILFILIWTAAAMYLPTQLSASAVSSYQLALWSHTSNWLIGIYGWESVPLPVEHLWTLAIEEQFYLFWPFIIFFLSRRNALIASVVLALFAFGCRYYMASESRNLAAYVLTPSRLDCLVIGGAWALIFSACPQDKNGRALLSRNLFLALAISATLAFGFIAWIYVQNDGLRGEDSSVVTYGLSALALFFGSIVALLASSQRIIFIRSAIANPVFRWLGRHSYCIYLVHQPICIFLIAASAMPTIAEALGARSAIPLILVYLGVPAALCCMVAWLSWRFVETPFLRLKDRFI